MIPSQRHLFDLPDDVAYLNCAYMGPLSRRVVAAGHAGVERKARPWEIGTRDFFDESWRTRELFGRIVGAQAADIAIVPAASYGLAVAARNLPVAAGQSIVMLAEQFPSNVYAWRERARACGATVRTVARPSEGDWTRAVIDAIDAGTAVATLPHCHWTDGGLLDLVRIGAHCRAHGTALVLDVTQSLGALPLDVAAVQPDFMIAACYKWLLGPYSLGMLYVAPRWHGGEPLEHSWIGRAGSEDFSELVNYRDDYQPGAQRYDMGERANFHLMPMAAAAFEQILEWGVAEIAATLRARTEAIAARAAEAGLSSIDGRRRAGHFLGLRFPGGVPAGLAEALAAERIFVSVRGDSVRVTPHLYNTDADVEHLFAGLATLLR